MSVKSKHLAVYTAVGENKVSSILTIPIEACFVEKNPSSFQCAQRITLKTKTSYSMLKKKKNTIFPGNLEQNIYDLTRKSEPL